MTAATIALVSQHVGAGNDRCADEVIFLALPLTVLFFTFGASLQGARDTKTAMWLVGISAGINVVIDRDRPEVDLSGKPDVPDGPDPATGADDDRQRTDD